ncbi:hypothetical protein G432_12150 [Sphingomonas sp. MM-1]|uniref:hypothetical protein n=1 Tax=Sphingomonas sp. MM-1 TaxID=745310 RepID=UPI0002C0700C|nr:hypothetical protein [Sphingomonas sp. MM-1]AGH50151.1 hypothetical protein G432_12150 [Sphingomonas sp. MM-1]
MKADIPKEERQRLEREQWAEIRAALVRRHFATMQEQMAIDATLHRLEREHLTQAAPAINAMLAGMGHAPVPLAAPVVIPEPEPVAPEPVAVRPGAPDLPFDLRQRFGLR